MIPILAIAGPLGRLAVALLWIKVLGLVSDDVERARAAQPTLTMTSEDDPNRQALAIKGLAGALEKYPPAILLRDLDAVVIVRDLAHGAVPYGGIGSSDHRRILLSTRSGVDVDPDWWTRAFHHEFAHLWLVRRNWQFPLKAWQEATDPQWKYPEPLSSGDAVLSLNLESKLAPERLYAMGFARAYGAVNLHEDVATFAESVVADDQGFRELTRRYPRLRRKAQLLVDFYRQAIPSIHLEDYATIR